MELTTYHMPQNLNSGKINISSVFGNALSFLTGQNTIQPEIISEKAETGLSSHLQVLCDASIISITDLQDNIIYVNDKLCAISGYTRKELIGSSINMLRCDMSLKEKKEIQRIKESGKVWYGEIKNRKKDGSVYWVQSTITPVFNSKGKIEKFISVKIDITEQKLIQENLRAEKEKSESELFENMEYAKHVHGSFLTPEEEINETFPESWLIYNAQKVISGDFYRVETKGSESMIVVGDSTGHGISASYMSIMVLNILSRISKRHSNEPSAMLTAMHNEIILATKQNRKPPIIESADTMVCFLDHTTRILNYASAKFRGVVVRGNEIIELKKDKCSIGEHSDREVAIENHQLQLQKGDWLYLFSDGMTDQFGGEANKKLGYSRLLQLLSENGQRPSLLQKKNIREALENWQGKHEQTDDMTLLALKIN